MADQGGFISPQESDWDREWSVVNQKVADDCQANRWDSALLRLDALASVHPEIRRSGKYFLERVRIEAFRNEADHVRRESLERSRKLLVNGQWAEARKEVDVATMFYPERMEEMRTTLFSFLVVGGGLLLAFLAALIHRWVGGAKT